MIKNTNEVYKSNLTLTEKFAIWITDKVGTIGFFLIVLGWTILWLSWNMFAPLAVRFDPYPAFVLWLFISNMLQIFLMPLIMVGQNLQSKHAEIRSEHDYEIDCKAEKEIEDIILRLDKLHKFIEHMKNVGTNEKSLEDLKNTICQKEN